MRARRGHDRVLDRHPAGDDVLVERLVERLHAVVAAFSDDLAERAGLRGVEDHVARAARHPQDLADRDTAALGRGDQAL